MLNNPNYVKIRPRRGSKLDWEQKNPVLLEGEIAIEYPNGGISSTGKIKMKIGDGVTPWNDLKYFLIENGDQDNDQNYDK